MLKTKASIMHGGDSETETVFREILIVLPPWSAFLIVPFGAFKMKTKPLQINEPH